MDINGKKNVRKIILTHKGTRYNYGCIYKKPNDEESDRDLYLEEPLFIEFSDTCEIDILIDMLRRFKNEVNMNIGEWKTEQACKTCVYEGRPLYAMPCGNCAPYDSGRTKWRRKEN